MSEPRAELLKGTLDLLILQALTDGAQHGYGVARWLEAASRDLLRIEEGSLYPALSRMERRGGSDRSGVSRTPTEKPSTTASHAEVGTSFWRKPQVGIGWWKPCPWS